MNTELARHNMIHQQIRCWDVLDDKVLAALLALPREDFVPPAYRKLAFADTNIPLGFNQVMLTPKEEGRILQALNIKPTDKVLEIGSGSGYFAAVLAHLAAEVISVEIMPELHAMAKKNIEGQKINNITLELGNGAEGWETRAPYDIIVISGSLTNLPQTFLQQTTSNTKIFAMLGREPVMEATVLTQVGKDEWMSTGLFETVVPALLHQKTLNNFEF